MSASVPRGRIRAQREPLLARLSGDERLVVLLAPRFMEASELLRAWSGTAAPAGALVACVIDPPGDVTEDEYWARLASGFPRGGAGRVGDDDDVAPFADVLSRLSAQEAPVVLVLDHLHLLAEPGARLDELFGHAPPAGLQIIAASRTHIADLGRVSRTASCRFITGDALLWDAEDIAAAAGKSGIDIPARSAEIIRQLTGGLPALVRGVVAAVPKAQLVAPEHLAEYVPGAIDAAMDFEIRWAPDLAPFRRELLLSAAADPLTDAALALVARERAAEFTALLEEAGIPQVTGGPSDRRWVYPDPVRASLLRLALTDHPEDLQELRHALIELWLDLDRPNKALKVAADMEDWGRVIEVVREHKDTLYTRDYPTTMGDQILARVPEELLEEEPQLLRLRSMHHQFAAPRDTPVPASEFTVDEDGGTDPAQLVMRAIELRVDGRFTESAQLCDRLVASQRLDPETPPDDQRDALAFAQVHLGASYLLAGRDTDAISILRRAFRTAQDGSFIRRDAAGKLALAYIMLGRPGDAERWREEELRYPALPSATEALVRPAGDVAAALLALERLDLDGAGDILDDLGPPDDREEFWGFILYARALLALLRGTPAEGVRSLRTEMLRFTTMRDHGAIVGPLLDAVAADLRLACGDPEGASELVGASTHPLTAPTRARTLLLNDEPAAAAALCRQALADLRVTSRDAVELDLVAAAAAVACDDPEAGASYLRTAVSVAETAELLRPFRSLPAEVMHSLAGLGVELPLVPDPALPPPGTAGAEQPLAAASLSEREAEVLRALTTGATNREIAASTHVSINTVKTQLKAVYRKLGTSSREETVAAARRLGLV